MTSYDENAALPKLANVPSLNPSQTSIHVFISSFGCVMIFALFLQTRTTAASLILKL